MKKYENPIMNVSLFDTENISTTASSEPTAFEQAQIDAKNLAGEDKTFTIVF